MGSEYISNEGNFRRQSYRRLIRYAKPYKYKLAVGILAGVLGLLLHATEGAGADSVVTLGALDERLTLLTAGDGALDSCHV